MGIVSVGTPERVRIIFDEIKLKDTKIFMRDLNQLTPSQLSKIRKESENKSLIEWRDRRNKETVKIQLTRKQKLHLLRTKDYIFRGKTALDILMDEKHEIIEFSPHFTKRAAWRIENKDPDSPLSPRTLPAILELVMNAELNDIDDEAEWKGYPTISYNFIGEINDVQVVVAVAFKQKVLFVTLIDLESDKGEYGLSIEELIGKDHDIFKKSF